MDVIIICASVFDTPDRSQWMVVSTIMKRIITGFPEEDVLLIGDRPSNEIFRVGIAGSILSFTWQLHRTRTSFFACMNKSYHTLLSFFCCVYLWKENNCKCIFYVWMDAWSVFAKTWCVRSEGLVDVSLLYHNNNPCHLHVKHKWIPRRKYFFFWKCKVIINIPVGWKLSLLSSCW